MLNLAVEENIPMIAVIFRLVAHKGVDLLKSICNELMGENVQLVILGKGNAEYEAFFSHQQTQYPHKLAAVIAYNQDLSHKIYAAADIFLMPSKSEPCGLSQMIASRYGALPVVRETGGLYDSIRDCGGDGAYGNGITFAQYTAADFLNAVRRAIKLYRNKEVWSTLIPRVMNVDFSWRNSAKEYIDMYDRLMQN